MKVRATRRGYFGRLYEPGAEFDIDERQLSSWMEPVDPEDQKRLAERMKTIGAHVRPPARPGVPPTTGPGYGHATVPLDRLTPKIKPEPKPEKPPKGEPKA